MSSVDGTVCAIQGCVNKKTQKQRKHLAFYRFPKTKTLVSKWLDACNNNELLHLVENQDSTYLYRKRYLVCSDHFEPKYFKNKNLLSQGLIKSAVPTRNLPCDKNYIKSSEILLEMDEVKIKVEQTCHGCLSTDRRISPLEDLNDMFITLIPTAKDITVYLCWECIAILKRLNKFQKQLKNAQDTLTQTFYNYISLSTLTTSKIDYYDQDIKHQDAYEDNLNCKEHLDIKEENIEVKNLEIDEITENSVDESVDFSIDESDKDVSTNEAKITKVTKTFDATDDKNQIDEESNENTNRNLRKKYDETHKSGNDNKRKSKFGKHCNKTSNKNLKTKTVNKIKSLHELVNKNMKRKKELANKRKSKRTKSENWKNTKQEYKNYAKLIRQDWEKPYTQYFEKVHLDEKEIEECFLKNDRKRQGYKMRFECRVCSLGYARQIDLDRHNDLNHHKPNTDYKCQHCQESLPSHESLKAHWRTHSVFYRCVVCSVYVFPCSLALHLSRSHVNVYECTSCTLSFSTLVLFSEHYNKNHPFVCDYCNKKCALRSVLEKHIKNHHTPQSCEPCARVFESYRLYRSHCREIHPEILNIGVDPEQCYCVECDQQYPSVALYKKHINSKHTQKPPKLKKLPCPECGKAFTKNSDMLLHYNFAHVKITKYHCDLCDKYFLKMYGLRTHMERVHLKLQKPKDKICDLCGRAFQSNSVLENHRRTHTGERPFQCAACPAAFAQKGAMRIHQRKQHAT